MDRKTIVEGFKLMEHELKRQKSEQTVDPSKDPNKVGRWLTFFEGTEPKEFLAGCIQAVNTLTFFPTVAELKAIIEGTDEDKAVEAWEIVRAAIARHGADASYVASDFHGDTAALWALARLGIERVASMTKDSRAIIAAEFRKLYSVARHKGYGLVRMAGQFEIKNKAMGFDVTKSPALCGRPDTSRVKALAGGPDSLPAPAEIPDRSEGGEIDGPVNEEDRAAMRARLKASFLSVAGKMTEEGKQK